MKYRIYLIFLLFSSISAMSQQKASFFVEIPNIEYIPVVSHDSNGKLIGSTKTKDLGLNNLINTYKIFSNNKVFKNSNKASLQNIYLIECDNIQLMHDLYTNFSSYYPRVEDAYRETMLTPGDFGNNGGYTGTAQHELTYIRAPEAWDITTGSKSVRIGVADTNFQDSHEDLSGDLFVVGGPNNPNAAGDSAQHGSWVASIAGASTNNYDGGTPVGMASIGYNSTIYAYTSLSAIALDELSQMETKVLNASWGTSSPNPPSITPGVYDEIINDRNVVVVAAAGNGGSTSTPGLSETYYRPASYQGVIAVSSIGQVTEQWVDPDDQKTVAVTLDSHEWTINGWPRTHQHNDSIDIVAPGVGVTSVHPENGINAYRRDTRGTSMSAPMVSGTVGLMFAVNYCLDPKEVETILKLTAVKIDTLPQNLPYYGKLGAGKLDAYEAVKMSKDMADPFGTVEVKNRILYRPWFYKLVTAPYEIKLSNNDVSGGSKLKFRARNNIEIISGTYMPDTGYIDLQIDENLDLNWCPAPPTSAPPQTNNTSGKTVEEEEQYVVFPTLVKDQFTIKPKHVVDQPVDIKVFDFFGVEVFSKTKVLVNEDYVVLFNKFRSGIYVLKIYDKGNVVHTEKLVKK